MAKAMIRLIGILLIGAVCLAGCSGNSVVAPASGGKEPPEMQQPAQMLSPDAGEEAATRPVGEITDRTELQKLWEEYFFDAVSNVGAIREFNSAREIAPLYVAMFAWYKYVGEYGTESLEPESEDGGNLVFPLEIVLEYARHYFDLAELELSGMEHPYDPQRRAFLFGMGVSGMKPAYDSGSPVGEKLSKVIRNSDGTLTAVITRYHYLHKDRRELTRTYTLKEREDGSLYYLSGRWEYINNNLVSLSGEYRRFGGIAGYTGNMEEGDLSMAGEMDGKLLLVHAPYEKGKKSALLLADPAVMRVEKNLELQEQLRAGDVRLLGEKCAVFLQDKIVLFDKSLELMESVPLPRPIKDKNRPDKVFGGYNVTADFQQMAYADEVGVKLYNLADGTEKLLAPSERIPRSIISHHRYPRFVAGGRKVITTMQAYEGGRGYMVCNLAEGTSTFYGHSLQDAFTDVIRYDTGLLEVNSSSYNQEENLSEIKTLYLDFATEEIKEIALAEPGEDQSRRPSDYCYVGPNHAAFITYTWDSNDNDQSMFYLNHLNLDTFTLEERIIAVKAAHTYILGVLPDGRIVFWYFLNPSESGVCITKR
ncbi:MAG: hypothetical protein RBT41_02530 [Clostridia bacterium]|jgi:hypothetical protein|nr:hypothetical protein [Clostridia bacterium]